MVAGARWQWGVLLIALLLGAGLRAEGLASGFFADDYEQLALVGGDFPLQRAAWDLFWFGPRDEAERARLLDFGFLPWWSAAEHRIAMFRPLASALLWLDSRAFGAVPLGYHVHALLWWALLLTAAQQLLLRVLSPASAALALLLFALAPAHQIPLCWIANRSTLIAAPRWLWLAALGWTLALGAGEYAFGMLAYAIAHAWLARDGADGRAGARVRLTAVVAAGLPAAAYLALRAGLGHGVVASGLYLNPQDGRFLAVAPGRWLALTGELVLGLPAKHFYAGAPLREWLWQTQLFTLERWQRLPDWPLVHGALGVLALALGGLALRWLAGRAHEAAPRSAGAVLPAEYASVRWLLVGSALGVLSAGTALPESRLLVAPALGACAALAVFALHALAALRARFSPLLALGLVAVLALHGALAAQRAWSDGHARRERNAAARRFAFEAPLPVRAAALDVVLIAAGDFSTASVLPWIRRLHGAELPRSYRRLSGAVGPHRLRRIDAHTLDVTLIGASPGAFAGSLYRPLDLPLRPAQRVVLPGMSVQVRATRQGDAVQLRVRCDRPLEHRSLLWLHPYPSGLRRVRLPPPGDELLLPPPAPAQ